MINERDLFFLEISNQSFCRFFVNMILRAKILLGRSFNVKHDKPELREHLWRE